MQIKSCSLSSVDACFAFLSRLLGSLPSTSTSCFTDSGMAPASPRYNTALRATVHLVAGGRLAFLSPAPPRQASGLCRGFLRLTASTVQHQTGHSPSEPVFSL